MIDRAGLAAFLRRRREALQPEDVGVPRGRAAGPSGLRREEVAALCHMSTDYYSRLERERGPQPSEQMIASIAQGLHLSLEERDHLFRLAGHHPPVRGRPASTSARACCASSTASPTPLPRSSPSSARRCARARWVWPSSRRHRYTRPRAQPRLPVVHRPRRPGCQRPGSTRSSLGCTPRACGAGHPARTRFAGRIPRRSSCGERGVPTLWNAHDRSTAPRRQALRAPRGRRAGVNCQTLLDPRSPTCCSSTPRPRAALSYDELQLLSVLGLESVTPGPLQPEES